MCMSSCSCVMFMCHVSLCIQCDPCVTHMWSMYHHVSMHAVQAMSRYIHNTYTIHLEKRGPLVLHPHSCIMMYLARRYHAPIHASRNTSIPYVIHTTIHKPRWSTHFKWLVWIKGLGFPKTVCHLQVSTICIWMYLTQESEIIGCNISKHWTKNDTFTTRAAIHGYTKIHGWYMRDTRRCALNDVFQVLKPSCLHRARCFAVVAAAVFIIRGILEESWKIAFRALSLPLADRGVRSRGDPSR